MNNLETLFIPEEIKNKELAGKLVVVIDVLRASSTIVTALANGCNGFIPILSPEQAKDAHRIIIGSFLNLQAVCDYCTNYQGDISIICAGKEGQFFLEDAACAGRIIHSLRDVSFSGFQEVDANLTAQLLYEKFGNNILKILRKSQHGRYLESIGLVEGLKFFFPFDFFSIVPIFRDGIISI